MPESELFLYLCTHSSRHSWFRLKWIADIAALLHRVSANTLGGIVARTAAFGIAPPVFEALLRAYQLLAAPVPQALLAKARADRRVLRRVEVACRTVAVLGVDGDPFTVAGFTTRLDLEEYRIRSGWRYRRAVLQRHALSRLYRGLQPPGRGRRDEPVAQ